MLKIVYGNNIYLLREDTSIVMGRGAECDMRLRDGLVSERHALITNGHIMDVGSTNGTNLNGTLVNVNAKVKLRKNDQITVGDTCLRVEVATPEDIEKAMEAKPRESKSGSGSEDSVERTKVRAKGLGVKQVSFSDLPPSGSTPLANASSPVAAAVAVVPPPQKLSLVNDTAAGSAAAAAAQPTAHAGPNIGLPSRSARLAMAAVAAHSYNSLVSPLTPGSSSPPPAGAGAAAGAGSPASGSGARSQSPPPQAQHQSLLTASLAATPKATAAGHSAASNSNSSNSNNSNSNSGSQHGASSAFAMSDEQLTRMIDTAFDAKKHAHCPYSNFRVGASVLTRSGKIYKGCNVENASYGLTICAERVALCQAVADGSAGDVAAVMCSTDIKEGFKFPCGACLQFILEFGEDVSVFAVQPDRRWAVRQIRELAPLCFSPVELKKERVAGSS